ncbi:ABC transporter, permease protein, partial [mine drainage metagenome]
ITRNFMGPQLGGGEHAYDTVLVPEIVTQYAAYDLLVRTQPGKRAVVLREAKRHIDAADQNAVVGYTWTLSHAKYRMYSGLRNLAVFLSFLTLVMLVLCCLGIFGLGTFNVVTRTRQIGIRRALGARRRDIVTLFLAENAITVSAGAIFGCFLALASGSG